MTKTFSISCPMKALQWVDGKPLRVFCFSGGNILKVKLEDGTLITVEVSEWGSVSIYPPKQGKDEQ